MNPDWILEVNLYEGIVEVHTDEKPAVGVVVFDSYPLGRWILEVTLYEGIVEVHTDEMLAMGECEDKYEPDCAP